MKVLVIGGGGREHALGYGISLSDKINELYFAPGNAGTSKIGTNVDLPDNNSILNFSITNRIDLVVIGPEQPLVDGLTDCLENAGLKVFGPSKEAARLESDKIFAKTMMEKANIPTAAYKSFNSTQKFESLEYLNSLELPIVIKANGLAAGKGVAVCHDYKEAKKFIEDLFDKKVFGSSGEEILIEEFLTGEEASIFAITDGEDYILLPAAQDHKRIGDNDTGKNTGGMGAYLPAPVVTQEIIEQVKIEIIEPMLKAMSDNGTPFRGCLYCGLMIDEGYARVVEFNCRFGDPETQVVIPAMEGDWLELFYSVAERSIDKFSVWYEGKSVVTIVAASGGYPDEFNKGFVITGLESKNDGYVFHSGTKLENDQILTNGGRVLTVTAESDSGDIEEAINKAYKRISKIDFEGIYYRRDIGAKGLKYIK